MKLATRNWALVTGASSGIGETFARELAARGISLILVARSEQRLRALATELSDRHGIRTDVIVSDLSREGAPAELYAACQSRGHQVDILVNNAGFATWGLFDELSPDREHQEIMLNVVALADLTRLFLPAMVERRSGTIINIASTAAFQPVPYMAVYGATKAFVLSFTEALWKENQHRGVTFFALCPGATATNFFNVVGSDDAAVGTQVTPEAVVRAGLRALEKGRHYYVHGTMNYLGSIVSRLVTRRMTLSILEGMTKPKK